MTARVLIVVEPHPQTLLKEAKKLLKAALMLGKEVAVLVVGRAHEDLAKAVSQLQGVNTVYWAKGEAFDKIIAESVAACVLSLVEDYNFILSAASTFGKNILPKVAAKLDVAQVSDVINIISEDIVEHPIYAGNVIETVKLSDNKKCFTIRLTAFEEHSETQSACEIKALSDNFEAKGVRYLNLVAHVSKRPDLTQAEKIVSGGRALQSQENFKLIEALADALGAAVGASRAAVDAGFIPNDFQVGQTGKVVAPLLYIAVGISGAIQHIAGMKDAKVIVAINKDPEAPIFQIATYGLVGDLFTIIPELTRKLQEVRSGVC